MSKTIAQRVMLAKWKVREWLLFSLNKRLALPIYCLFYLIYPVSRVTALKFLMAGNRYTLDKRLGIVVKKFLPNILEMIDDLLPAGSPEEGVKWIIKRSIVLKDPTIAEDYSVIEKGVLLVKFTTTFPYYKHVINCEALLRVYHLVLEPSWSGYCLPEILFWAKFSDTKIIVEASEQADREFIELLDCNLIAVEPGSGDWVDFRVFKPLADSAKIYDVIYVANYDLIKRPHVLFKAIRNVEVQNYKAALVCGLWGDKKTEVLGLIDYYGIANKIDIYEGLAQHELNRLLNRSKVNVLLSLKEGSNRSLFEGFFSGTPGIVLKENIGVNKRYFNHKSGLVVEEAELKSALEYMANNWSNYDSRGWAKNNLTPHKTTEKLQEILKQIADEELLVWQRDMLVKTNCPEANYFNPEDAGSVLSMGDLVRYFRSENINFVEFKEELSK